MATVNTFEFVPASLAIKAMRDSGYKNAAYAIAELVDNAIQANATVIEILCEESEEWVNQRHSKRISKIAVIDNGDGMSARILRKALQFGNGERLTDRSGIGRFGMGLPNSSISQAKRVDVWSWQKKGSETAIHTYLDVQEVEDGGLVEVPDPEMKPPPKQWLARSHTAATSKSGTIVLWSNLDKCDWRTASALFRNSELTIGRIYRRFIGSKKLSIRMAGYLDRSRAPDFDDVVKPNDPMYLMSDTCCPAPWDHEPMFEKYGEPALISVPLRGTNYTVRVTFSIAKRAARAGHNSGENPYGKHAKTNVGVSVIRADRELELQTGWCNTFDTRERWWGIEVDFPPELDEIFGVTNNKQSARALSELAQMPKDLVAEREGFTTEIELISAWEKDEDLRVALLKVKNAIESNLGPIRNAIKAQAESKSGTQRHADPASAEAKGTGATKQRQDDGHHGSSDAGEDAAPSIRTEEIAGALVDAGMAEDEAGEKAENVLKYGQKFEFFKADLASPEFFSVRPKGGVILIGLNTNHPAYEHLVTLLEGGERESDVTVLRTRLRQSYEGLKLLLEAWARYEDELTDGPRKIRAQEARLNWGMVARQFFQES